MGRTLTIGGMLKRGVAVGVFSFSAAAFHAVPALALDDAALPSGGVVAGGSASFDYSAPNELHVHQSSDRAVIDWDSFNIGSGALTQFHQNSSSSIVVNRVTGNGDPTRILGTLRANGIVVVLDRNGVIYGENSVVDVGSIVTSTGSIDNAAFMAGNNLHLTNIDTGGSIINHGMISVADAGLAAFVAPTVVNNGVITAKLGRIQIGSGESATLDLYGDGLLEVAVSDEGMSQALANTGILSAEGGTIQITAAAAKGIIDSVINLDGVVTASSATVKGGRIILGADTIHVAETAKLDASSTAGKGGEVILYANDTAYIAGSIKASGSTDDNGGFIETSATSRVTIADTAHIDTGGGNWLIDPTNFTIANSGGDITTATLAAQLALNNVTIETADAGSDAGDIFVQNALTWTGNKTLSLKAHRNIEVNAAITNTTGGSLLLRADKTGSGTGTVIFGASGSAALSGGGRTDLYYNPTAYTTPTNFAAKVTGTSTAWMLVNNVTQLQAMNTSLGGSYALGRNIDASATSTWNAGAGFVPVGSSATKFTGKFDGLGHTITGLTINRPTTDNIALFGYANGASISNIGSAAGSVTGRDYTGALIGSNNNSTITNSYATGTVTGRTNVAGLIGYNIGGSTISNSYATGAVSGTSQVGGLIGYNYLSGTISDSYATGTVSGSVSVGGLIGLSTGSTITNSYATGTISGAGDNVGGLVGYNHLGGTISDSHATGTVVGGGKYVGGLVGQSTSGGIITNSYATGAVSGTGTGHVGGLVGISTTNNITGSHATGNVSGTSFVGGLVGHSSGDTISYGHATGTATGNYYAGGLVGGIESSGSAISHSYATGTVSAGVRIAGGLVGYIASTANNGAISYSYATGAVSSGTDGAGGLVGYSDGGVGSTISNSYATGNVSGTTRYVGGLLGQGAETISNSYATGSVSGNDQVGGLVGRFSTGTLSNSYATGAVAGTTNVGGLIGAAWGSPTITNSYWNTQTSGRATSSGTGAVGLTTAQMKQMASFSGWSIASTGGAGTIWRIYEGSTAPLLASFLTPLTVSAADVTVTYDANAYSGGSASYTGLKPGDTAAVLAGTLAYGGTSQGATNAGAYGISLNGGLYSGQQGYDISYSATPATLTIGKRDITGTVHDDARAYGDTNPVWDWTNVTWNNLAGGQNGSVLDAFLVSSTADAAGNPGPHAITITGFSDNNYNLTGHTPGILTIGPKPVLLPADIIRIVDAKRAASTPDTGAPEATLVETSDSGKSINAGAGCLAAMASGSCVLQ